IRGSWPVSLVAAIASGGTGCSGDGARSNDRAANLGPTADADVWVPTGDGGTAFVPQMAPSCAGLPATCGPSGSESCCTSLLVPGGTFTRGNETAWPATVSDFMLDRFEITVGRFRKFVEAGLGTRENPPAAGAGADPNNAATGWDPAWTQELWATSPL